jgi:two-component system nitrate/nitrite response regulator NarL
MILLDLNMKPMNGIEVLKVIKSWGLDSRVVMLTVSDEAADLVAALRAGADGYLLKEMEPEELLVKLKEAAAGQVTLTERLTRLLAHSLREDNKPKDPDQAGLTDQESRILDLIALGKSNKLIARELNIAEGTVKVHVKHLLRKLNLRSRVEAAVWAVDRRRGG